MEYCAGAHLSSECRVAHHEAESLVRLGAPRIRSAAPFVAESGKTILGLFLGDFFTGLFFAGEYLVYFKVISYGRFLKTETERFRTPKPAINLNGPGIILFSGHFFSDIIFGTASTRK